MVGRVLGRAGRLINVCLLFLSLSFCTLKQQASGSFCIFLCMRAVRRVESVGAHYFGSKQSHAHAGGNRMRESEWF